MPDGVRISRGVTPTAGLMNSSDHSFECEAFLDLDGTLRIPGALARRFGKPGPVVIRLTAGKKSRRLALRGVAEDEVDAIAAMQMEERAQVVRFLEAEGRLAQDRSFGRGGKTR